MIKKTAFRMKANKMCDEKSKHIMNWMIQTNALHMEVINWRFFFFFLFFTWTRKMPNAEMT